MNMKYIITESQYKLIMEASSPAQQAAIAINMKKKGIKPKNESLYEDEFGSVEETDYEGDSLNEAEYQGRKVQLGKIMQGDIKKFKVYVKNDKGKVVKVNFGFGGKSAHGKRMVIKKIIQKEENHLEHV